MIKILIITHGNLAKEFVQIAEAMIGKPIDVIPVCLDMNLGQEAHTGEITDLIKSFDSDQKVIVLTDLFGGTPSNITIPLIEKDRIEVITGINLPMLLYILSQSKEKGFSEICKGAKKASQDAVIIAGEFLS